MADYNKLRTIIGNNKTLASELASAGVREENPYDFRETDIMFAKKSQWDNLYQVADSSSTSGGNRQIEVINGEGWVGNFSLGIRIPQNDGAGNTIQWKPCALLYLLNKITVRVGSTEVMSYNNYDLFNALMQGNNDEIKKELLFLLQPVTNNAGTPEFTSQDDVEELRIPLFAPGTNIEFNRNDDKPRPFPLGKCQNNMIFRIELNNVSDAVETSLDASTGTPVAFTPFSNYDSVRLYYDKYVIQGTGGAVVDEDSNTKGNAEYPYFSLEGTQPNELSLNNSNLTQISVENLRKDGELTAMMFSVVNTADQSNKAFENRTVNALTFKLGNDIVYNQDSGNAIVAQYLLQNRNNSYINTVDGGFYDMANGGGALYNIPFSRQPLEPFESQFYGVNPDKLQMTLSLKVRDAGTYFVPCTGLYKTMIKIRNGQVIRNYVSTN